MGSVATSFSSGDTIKAFIASSSGLGGEAELFATGSASTLRSHSTWSDEAHVAIVDAMETASNMKRARLRTLSQPGPQSSQAALEV